VRFGNVLNSRGSVIPIFKKQISNGGPLTITDKRMTRFFMTIQDSVNFILMVGEMARGREVFVLKMPSVKITDLADVMIRKYSPKKKVKTIITGKRMGEKYHEYLMTEEESERAYEMGNIIAILPEPLPFEDKNLIKPPDGFIRMKEKITSSERGTVSRQEIINLLKRIRNGEQ
jgi:FlaA1/EpsC-like NDP-sugar epimerase